jgi:hypothetical protein
LLQLLVFRDKLPKPPAPAFFHQFLIHVQITVEYRSQRPAVLISAVALNSHLLAEEKRGSGLLGFLPEGLPLLRAIDAIQPNAFRTLRQIRSTSFSKLAGGFAKQFFERLNPSIGHAEHVVIMAAHCMNAPVLLLGGNPSPKLIVLRSLPGRISPPAPTKSLVDETGP